MFSVPAKGYETNLRAFSLKHLNIIDPLKQDNNLGRSVSRSMHSLSLSRSHDVVEFYHSMIDGFSTGNFYRICSAFKYGARKLG